MSNDNLILGFMKKHRLTELVCGNKRLLVGEDGTIVTHDENVMQEGWSYVGTDLAAALKALAGEE